MTLRAPRVQDDADAAQAFVVALDYLLSVGDQGRTSGNDVPKTCPVARVEGGSWW